MFLNCLDVVLLSNFGVGHNSQGCRQPVCAFYHHYPSNCWLAFLFFCLVLHQPAVLLKVSSRSFSSSVLSFYFHIYFPYFIGRYEVDEGLVPALAASSLLEQAAITNRFPKLPTGTGSYHSGS